MCGRSGQSSSAASYLVSSYDYHVLHFLVYVHNTARLGSYAMTSDGMVRASIRASLYHYIGALLDHTPVTANFISYTSCYFLPMSDNPHHQSDGAPSAPRYQTRRTTTRFQTRLAVDDPGLLSAVRRLQESEGFITVHLLDPLDGFNVAATVPPPRRLIEPDAATSSRDSVHQQPDTSCKLFICSRDTRLSRCSYFKASSIDFDLSHGSSSQPKLV